MSNNIIKGKLGEEIAEKYLKSLAYTILEKNYRIKMGEIDIIAMKKDILVFVEVKTRSSINYGYPCEAVNRKKQIKIIKTALHYIKSNGMGDYQIRFDIIEVYFKGKGKINHIENAFCI